MDIIYGNVLILCSQIEQVLCRLLEDTDYQSWRIF